MAEGRGGSRKLRRAFVYKLRPTARQSEASPFSRADRSTGVQQGRGSVVHEQPERIKVCPVCKRVDERPLQMYCGQGHELALLQQYVVSPEPRVRPQFAEGGLVEPREGEQGGCDARIGERRCRLPKGHEGYHDMPYRVSDEDVRRGIAAIRRAQPHTLWVTRAAEQVARAVLEAVEPGPLRAASPDPRDELQIAPRNSKPLELVARELRLTASRLRDPEYHWYEHAAVTLERLAEKLEKGRDDG